MGSCAMVEGCSIFDSLRGACTGYDLSRSPCSPLFAAPEAFVSPSDPFAFDIYRYIYIYICGVLIVR